MDPVTIAALIGAAGSIGGSLISKGGSKETKIQRSQKKLIDQLMNSVSGQGPYSDLFNMDEAAFQKSYVEPAKSRFRNQIAPQIQQEYIASGQQRGTGLDDTLARAGVDMDQLINQEYMKYQQQAQQNKMSVIQSILNQSQGAAPQQSFGQDAGQAVGGYLASDAFSNSVNNYMYQQPNQQYGNQQQGFNQPSAFPQQGRYPQPPRKGFAP